MASLVPILPSSSSGEITASPEERKKNQVDQATAAGTSDGEAGRPMDPSFINAPDNAGIRSIAKQAYAKAYVAAREKRGSGKRKTRKGGKRKSKARKTRGRK